MTRNRIFKGRALCVKDGEIWVARGLTFFPIDRTGRRVGPKFKVGSAFDRMLAAFRLPRQMLRVGIHHLFLLKEGGFLVTLKRRALVLDAEGKVIHVFTGFRGNKPGHRGICVTPDGDIFFGEYTVNFDNSRETSLYRSRDGGRSFQEILSFRKDEIRHIHFVHWDPYENCLWLGTGDKDYECRLMRSADHGETWEIVGTGSQLWRATGITVTREALFWGTDAGSVPDPNYLIRMDRATRRIEQLAETQGPCHGNAVLMDGTVFIATGVEGGQNEKDACVHVWRCGPDGSLAELPLGLKKDLFPYLVQFGVVRFPIGLEESRELVFTTYALQGNPEHVFLDDLEAGPGDPRDRHL